MCSIISERRVTHACRNMYMQRRACTHKATTHKHIKYTCTCIGIQIQTPMHICKHIYHVRSPSNAYSVYTGQPTGIYTKTQNTHACKHTQPMNLSTHSDIHSYARMYVTYAHPRVNTSMHTPMHKHMHRVHVYTCKMYMPTQAWTYTYTRIRTQKRPHSN